MIPPEPGPDPPGPGPDPPADNVWRVLSEDVTSNWGGSGATFYNDVMSTNGAFVGTVTAGFSSGNFYTTGIVKIGDNYYLGGIVEGLNCYIDGTSRYYWSDINEEWTYRTNVGTPFDAVPPNVMTYLANKDFTLTVE